MSRGGRRRIAFGAVVAALGAAAVLFWPRPGAVAPPVAPPVPRPVAAPPAPPPAPKAAPPAVPRAPEEPISAPAPRPPEPNLENGPRGDLVFRVLASESGEPVAGAEVARHDWVAMAPKPGEPPVPSKVFVSGGTVVPPEEGDPPGRIRVRGCLPTRHTFEIRGPGRAPGTFDVDAVAGVETRAPDVLLDPEARIRCRVLDGEGKPMPGVVLKVGKGIFQPTLAEATTDEDGVAVLGGLPAGTRMVGTRGDPDDSGCFIAVRAGETAEVVLGGRPQLEVVVVGPEEPRKSLILVPLVPGFDPLAIGDNGENVPSGTLMVESEGKGRFLVGGLAPGYWHVFPDGLPTFAVARVPEAEGVPVRVDIRATAVRVRFRRASNTGETSIGVAALRPGDAEAGLAGDPEALLRILVAEMDRHSARVEGVLTDVDVVVPGEGESVLYFGGDGLLGDPLSVTPSATAPPQPPLVDLVPGTTIRVRSRAVQEEDRAPGGGTPKKDSARVRWRGEYHLVAGRDGEGRIRALRVNHGDVRLSLPPGKWRIEFRGPGGLRRSGDVEVPEIGEAEFLVE